jgi:hypothetical protein
MSVEAEWLVEKFGEAKAARIIKECHEDPSMVDYYATCEFEPYDKRRQELRSCVRSVLKELYGEDQSNQT